MTDIVKRLLAAERFLDNHRPLLREAADKIGQLEQRGCQFDCRAKRRADFVAGFDAGVEDAADSGRIMCPELYKEVTERLWQERRKGDD